MMVAMKRFVLACSVVAATFLARAIDSSALLWMVNDPLIDYGNGETHKLFNDPVTAGLNGARVVARNETGGGVVYLSFFDGQSFDPYFTVVDLDKTASPASLPMWAKVPDNVNPGDPGWLFAIELGRYEVAEQDKDADGSIDDLELIWSIEAMSRNFSYEELQKHMSFSATDMPGETPWSPDVFTAVPEPSSGLLVLLGGALLALRRRRRAAAPAPGRTKTRGRCCHRAVAALLVCACAVCGLRAELVVSSNIHGLIRVDSSATNTIVSVPWTFYTQDGSPTRPIPANRLVSPRGMTAGDLLMQVTNEIAYAAWSLEVNAETGARSWQPLMSASRVESEFAQTRNAIATHSGLGTLHRGGGVWVIRQKPLDAGGTPYPIYLYGQWTKGAETVEIPGIVVGQTLVYGGYDTCTYTMLSNPRVTEDTDINEIDWDWELVGDKDTLVLNVVKTDTIVPATDKAEVRILFWDAEVRKWYYTEVVQVNKFVKKTVKHFDGIVVPAGAGFWYVRRTTGPLYLHWK